MEVVDITDKVFLHSLQIIENSVMIVIHNNDNNKGSGKFRVSQHNSTPVLKAVFYRKQMTNIP